MKAMTPENPIDDDRARITERPDGFYWQSIEGKREYGPFVSRLDAIQDMEYADSSLEAGETPEEAESEMGIADWIDPETGQPAEGSIPRIEDQ